MHTAGVFATLQSFLRSCAGAVCAALVLCLLIGRVTPHANVAAVALGCIALLGWVLPSLIIRPVRAELVLPDTRCTVGQRLCGRLELRNALPMPLPGLELTSRDAGVALTMPLHAAPGRSVHELSLHATQRGWMPLQSIEIATTLPFGLRRAAHRITTGCTCLAWPVQAAFPGELLLAESVLTVDPVMQSSSRGDSGEISALRNYRRGDSLRSIHWQQTARQDRLIVRERATGRKLHCRLVLDLRQHAYSNAAQFELAVSLVCGALHAAVSSNVDLTLVLGQQVIECGHGSSLQTALDSLALVQWDPTGSACPRGAGLLVTGSRATEIPPLRLIRAGGAALSGVAA